METRCLISVYFKSILLTPMCFSPYLELSGKKKNTKRKDTTVFCLKDMSFYCTSFCVSFPWKCYITTLEVKSVVTGVLTQCGYICHTFFFFSIASQRVFDLRLEQEVKLCVERNALFVTGVKQSSGRLIFAVLRFPSLYNYICPWTFASPCIIIQFK